MRSGDLNRYPYRAKISLRISRRCSLEKFVKMAHVISRVEAKEYRPGRSGLSDTLAGPIFRKVMTLSPLSHQQESGGPTKFGALRISISSIQFFGFGS